MRGRPKEAYRVRLVPLVEAGYPWTTVPSFLCARRTADPRFTAAALCVLASLLTGCGGPSGATVAAGGSSRTSYADNAQEMYQEALGDFRRGNCLDAEPVFRQVRADFPYSRFAALAELRVADCKYEQEAFPEAVQAYRQFVRFRPSHALIPYARFRIAESYFAQIPSDWLLAPPSHERDMGSTQEALRQLRRFILDFPTDDRVPEAEGMIQRSLHLLASHELYVARFYLDRRAYTATVGRLRTLLSAYEGSGMEAEAMLLLGRMYKKLRRRDEARETLEELVRRFPESPEAEPARQLLGAIGGG